ncbi:ubiquinone biosynthesis accessory factor UbiJ [Rheinheimera sp. WS51]|uniref:ubiquinone biosynthesis accessory factor UbiJ n=1 Tax=Rheinheimera sp. WS51 TaxID=3425886 RepID=UPI003D94E62E
MLPLLPQLLCAAAEATVAGIIKLDPNAKQGLLKLQGKQLSFTLRELSLTLVITATTDTLLFNQHNEPTDCAISTDFTSLKQLRDPSQLTRLIKADALQIDGDIQVAQQFSYFFEQLNPDWAQALSVYIGDAAAHRVTKAIEQIQRYITEQSQHLTELTTELAQDELRLSPTSIEVAQFSQHVSDVAARVALLQQQLNKYQES